MKFHIGHHHLTKLGSPVLVEGNRNHRATTMKRLFLTSEKSLAVFEGETALRRRKMEATLLCPVRSLRCGFATTRTCTNIGPFQSLPYATKTLLRPLAHKTQFFSIYMSTAAADLRRETKRRKHKPQTVHPMSPLPVDISVVSIEAKPKRSKKKKRRSRNSQEMEDSSVGVAFDWKTVVAPPPTTRTAVDKQSKAHAAAKNVAYDPLPPTSKNRQRRSASQFIPLWLRQEPTWRRAVMEFLKLPTNLDNNRRNLNASLQGNFYQDSIPSFSELLKKGPPESLYPALDHLVEVGLSDAKTAEKYRQTHRLRLKDKDLRAFLAEKQKKLNYHQEMYNVATKELKQLQDRLSALTPPSENSNSIWKRTVESVSRLFQSEEQRQSAEHQNSVVAVQRTKLLQAIAELERGPLARHQTAVDAINVQWAMLHEERTTAGPLPLTDDEYSVLTQAAAAVRPAVTQAFAEHVRDRHSQMLEQYQALDGKTDLTRPHDWFLHARLDRRKIIFHGGPTNSGKTHSALEQLKTAKKGMYLGPLRLLAAEVYEKLTADGIYCNLYTGQERREIPFATHGAATIEMATTKEDYDVIVIDEIQMIADWERGFAWTRALLGSRCKEIHVCGGMEAAKIVRRIAKACGDEFEIRTYKRFSELNIAPTSLASQPNQLNTYKHVQAGDCVVAFSRSDIFAIKREIESNTEHKCCVIYGSLPPSTRSEQARRFNDPNSGYDVLVASDAIGMGLNLNIRRVIFNSIFKNDGSAITRLNHSAIKQISGRAGRRNSPYPIGGRCDGVKPYIFWLRTVAPFLTRCSCSSF